MTPKLVCPPFIGIEMQTIITVTWLAQEIIKHLLQLSAQTRRTKLKKPTGNGDKKVKIRTSGKSAKVGPMAFWNFNLQRHVIRYRLRLAR
jgi:hypothetical protein